LEEGLVASPTRGHQINVYDIDKVSRDRFKLICKKVGYTMNETLKEIIEFVLETEDEGNLRKFFQGRYGRDGK
jgi:hypothetical protein